MLGVLLAAGGVGGGCDRDASRPAPAQAGGDGAAAGPTSAPVVLVQAVAAPAAPVAPIAQQPAAPTAPPLADGTRPLFAEVTKEWGLGTGDDPARYPDGTYMTPEITPGGVAVFDYDGDGRLDILVICHPPPGPYAAMVAATAPNRLYHQEADGSFKEVAGAAGLGGRGFHHGVAVGDVNGDGRPDVYVCNYGGPDELFVNNGDGTFRDGTRAAGMPTEPAPRNWSSTAAFFDYDGDGHLDLFVARFATFNPEKRCQQSNDPSDADYCGPHTFPGQLATLYRNNGDGTFADLTKKAGINAAARGWGLICADLTGDGLADVFQANDEEPNQLWVNQGNGTFVDEAVLRGCAFNASGNVEANMGVTVGDIRRAGELDLYVTHITSESNTLWRNGGGGQFNDATALAGMSIVDRPFTGWGCGFFDMDNDGELDLAVANGRVAKGPPRPEARVGPFWNRYAEPNLLFKGDGSGRFADVSGKAGAFTGRMEVHRALAFADLHNRGSVDLVSVNLDNTLRVFRNDAAGAGSHWVSVLPMVGKRDGIGAQVTMSAGGRKQTSVCMRAYSYLASNDPRVHFGLGKAERVEAVEVRWPSGTPKRETFEIGTVDRAVVVRQGEGKGI